MKLIAIINSLYQRDEYKRMLRLAACYPHLVRHMGFLFGVDQKGDLICWRNNHVVLRYKFSDEERTITWLAHFATRKEVSNG